MNQSDVMECRIQDEIIIAGNADINTALLIRDHVSTRTLSRFNAHSHPECPRIEGAHIPRFCCSPTEFKRETSHTQQIINHFNKTVVA